MSRVTKGLAAGAATIGLLTAQHEQGVIIDYLRPPTAQEQLLGNLMLDSFGVDRKIRCVTEEELLDRRWPRLGTPSDAYGFTPALLFIWLRHDICDNVQRFAGRPAERVIELTPEEMLALSVFAHEGRHASGTDAENQAECEAAQVIYKIPLALGASAISAEQVGSATADQMGQMRKNATTYNLDDCKTGSPYDMRLALSAFPSD